MWHTQFCPSSRADAACRSASTWGPSYNLTAFQYLPRQDGSACGWIKDYEFYVSADGVNWGTAVATGTFDYGNLSTNCPGPGASVPQRPADRIPANHRAIHPPGRARRAARQSLDLGGRVERAGHGLGQQPAALAGQVTVNPAIVVGGSSARAR